jgi:hypothetical protein
MNSLKKIIMKKDCKIINKEKIYFVCQKKIKY